MKHIKRFISGKYFKQYITIALVLLVGLVLLLTAPWQSYDQALEPAPEPTAEPAAVPTLASAATPTPTPEPEQTPQPPSGSENPLTGLPMSEDASRDNRPLAIVLANTTDAIPMNGVSNADILYELLVEGGITRMLGIFQDHSALGKIGSVRSIRHYTVEIAASYDAILFASGGSEPAVIEVRNQGVTYFQEGGSGGNFFRRDASRIPGRTVGHVHSVIVVGDRLVEGLPDRVTRMEHDDDYEHALTFSDNATPAGGLDAKDVVVSFPGGKKSIFTYNTAENVYYMQQYNRDFTDANNSEHVSFANLIVLRMPISALTGPYAGAGRRDMSTVGSGDGYFAHGGKYIEIKWSRPDKASQFVYTLKDGSELELGRGTTYIGITSTNTDVTFK